MKKKILIAVGLAISIAITGCSILTDAFTTEDLSNIEIPNGVRNYENVYVYSGLTKILTPDIIVINENSEFECLIDTQSGDRWDHVSTEEVKNVVDSYFGFEQESTNVGISYKKEYLSDDLQKINNSVSLRTGNSYFKTFDNFIGPNISFDEDFIEEVIENGVDDYSLYFDLIFDSFESQLERINNLYFWNLENSNISIDVKMYNSEDNEFVIERADFGPDNFTLKGSYLLKFEGRTIKVKWSHEIDGPVSSDLVDEIKKSIDDDIYLYKEEGKFKATYNQNNPYITSI